MRILLVEDEPVLRSALARALRADGHAVDEVDTLRAAATEARLVDYGLILLDRGLPDGDGLRLLAGWRRAGRRTPVLILTARDAISDRIAGLDTGADDYVVKPVDLGELRARVRSLGRRARGRAEAVLRVADVELHPARAEVRRGGILLPLRPKEFSVLQFLMERPGRVLSRQQLREGCWDADSEPGSNVVEAAISALRRKLGDPPLIKTRRGLGYVFEA